MAGPASAAPAIDDVFGGAPDGGVSMGMSGSGSSAGTSTVDPFGGAPAPEDAPADVADPGTDADPGAESTIQYDEALAHESDTDAFVPGGRVTVPYTPRADDGWAVDGASPRKLPSGNATGTRIAAARQGTLWAGRPPADLADPTAADPPAQPTARRRARLMSRPAVRSRANP